MAGRRGGADDEFRCPVCHYLFPVAQRDHVQRCVRREMAQDPRIQRRMRTQTQQQRRGTTSANGGGAIFNNNKQRSASVASSNGAPPATNNNGATKLPPIKLPSKGAPAVKAPAAASKPAAPKPKASSLANQNKSQSAPKLPGARAGSNQPQPQPATNSLAKSEPAITIGQGGYVITHQSKTKPRDETKAQNRKSANLGTSVPGLNSITQPATTTSTATTTPSITVPATTTQPPAASSPPQTTVAPINLKKSKSKDKDIKKIKEEKKKEEKLKKASSKDLLKASKSATKPKTPREFIDAVSEAAAEKLPARVYSGMKQNEGTFWTFVINKTSTAVDLMDQVAAKCGVSVEQMALYAQTEKNVEVRIKDLENIYVLKLKWQNTNNNSKFLIKDRAAGDPLVRKSPDSVTSPITSPITSPVMSPVTSPVSSPPSSAPASPREEQEEQLNDSGEEDGDEQIICAVRSRLPTTNPGTLLNFLVGPPVKIVELLAFISHKHNIEAHKLGAYFSSTVHFSSPATLINQDETVLSVLTSLQSKTNIELMVKERTQHEGPATPVEIDVSKLDIAEIDEETLLKEQWEARKQMVGSTLSTMLSCRPSAQQLIKSGVIKTVQV